MTQPRQNKKRQGQYQDQTGCVGEIGNEIWWKTSLNAHFPIPIGVMMQLSKRKPLRPKAKFDNFSNPCYGIHLRKNIGR